MWRTCVCARHPAELARTQHISGIGKGSCDANGAGLLVHLAVDEDDAARMRQDGTVGERQSERKFGRRSGGQRCLVGAVDKGEIFAVADGEVDLDGVELRDGGEHRLRADEVADLRSGLARDTADE